MEVKRTVVLGASSNPGRYAYTAVQRLVDHGHNPVLVGIRPGAIEGIEIQIGQPELNDIDTITLFINRRHQIKHYSYILSLKPSRLIFNPGSENEELASIAREAGIEVLYACTLVLLATNSF